MTVIRVLLVTWMRPSSCFRGKSIRCQKTSEERELVFASFVMVPLACLALGVDETFGAC